MRPLDHAFDVVRDVTTGTQLFALTVTALVAAMFLFAGIAVVLVRAFVRVVAPKREARSMTTPASARDGGLTGDRPSVS